jgi:hypothetical protein
VKIFAEAGKEYALLADGNRRTAEKPKKKKLMHIQPSKTIIEFEGGGDAGALNAFLRKALKKYSETGMQS